MPFHPLWSLASESPEAGQKTSLCPSSCPPALPLGCIFPSSWVVQGMVTRLQVKLCLERARACNQLGEELEAETGGGGLLAGEEASNRSAAAAALESHLAGFLRSWQQGRADSGLTKRLRVALGPYDTNCDNAMVAAVEQVGPVSSPISSMAGPDAIPLDAASGTVLIKQKPFHSQVGMSLI